MGLGADGRGRRAERRGRIRGAGDVADRHRMDHRFQHALHRHPDILGAEQRAAAHVRALTVLALAAPFADLRRIERVPPALAGGVDRRVDDELPVDHPRGIVAA